MTRDESVSRGDAPLVPIAAAQEFDNGSDSFYGDGSLTNSSAFMTEENYGSSSLHGSSGEFEGGSGGSGFLNKDAKIKRVRRVSSMNILAPEQEFYRDSALDSTKASFRFKKEVALSSEKLRFNSLKVFGREAERKILVEALERIHSSNNQERRELVLVHGASGTGKTSLVATIENRVNKRLKGAFVVGKFELYQGDEPYSAIAAACRRVCGKLRDLRRKDWEAFHRIQYLICEKLGTEIHLLSSIFSELLEFVDDQSVHVPTMSIEDIDNETTKARLHFAIRTFLGVVAENMPPLVVVLDDVQWADAASLEILGSLASDTENRKLLFVCIYRSNEVGEDHPFSKLVKNLEDQVAANNLNISRIEVGNLSLQSVNEILMELLSCDNAERTFELAELCHRRTLGNAFFVLAFIRNLRDEQHLKFHQSTYQWRWDIKSILDNTSATKNVVELMKYEIERLPVSVVTRLSFAACLGSPFQPAVLSLVWEDLVNDLHGEIKAGAEDHELWLSAAVDGGFIEPANDTNTNYQWIHDSVREALLTIVPPDALVKRKAALGKSLLNRLSKEGLQAMVFVVANLIHDGQSSENNTASREVKYSKLNLHAAQKASSVSAFDSAAKYAARGIDLLPADRWHSLYELTLELYTVAAKSEMSIGKADLVEQRFLEVISQEDRPFADKIPLYSIMIYTSHSKDTLNSDDAIEMSLTALKGLGVVFPKSLASRTASSLSGIWLWRKRAKTITLEEMAALPTMRDETDQDTLRLLHLLVCMSFRSKKNAVFILLGTFKMLSLTFERGIADYSPVPFGLLSLIFSGMLGNFALGDKVSTIASDLLDRTASNNADAATLLLTMTFGKPWVEPLHNSIGPCLRGYKSGLSCGDTDFALLCNSSAVAAGFLTGQPLSQIENDCFVYGNQAIEFKRTVSLNGFKMYWLAAVIMMGRPANQRSFAGIDRTTNMDQLHEKMDTEDIDLIMIEGTKSILHCYLGEHEQGAKRAIANGNSYAKKNVGHFCVMYETFSRCLSLYAMARQSKSRKYKRHAEKVHKIIKKWREKGNPNVVHFDILLDAERAGMRGEFDVAEGLYQNAKMVASRSGLINDAALASERYGDFLLVARRNHAEAAYKFNEAIALYGELGAQAKVMQLRKEHSLALWPQPDEITIESSPSGTMNHASITPL